MHEEYGSMNTPTVHPTDSQTNSNGSATNLPLPAKELETLAMTVYTYGGNTPNPIFPEQ